ncbi:MAG: uracil-DNA glycosylase [Proteobacteria bacterium]|nr:uracil-DNA glycosylase [Pseudomonadota bacterium]
MADEVQQDGLLAWLAWWREAGIGDALEESPIDWSRRPDQVPGAEFAWPNKREASGAPPQGGRPERSRPIGDVGTRVEPARSAPIRSAQQPSARPVAASAPSASAPPQPALPKREPWAVTSAREIARSAKSLAEIEDLLGTFGGCPLKATAKNLCFYRGSPTARLMVIGEAPGRDEDLAGKPFVGRAGQLLDKMLGAIGLSEEHVHITNIVYWRPPGNRTPTPEEAQACRPFLERQIELVAPEVLLTLGGPASKAILDSPDGILKLRGKWKSFQSGGRAVRVMPSLHPAYLLRQPEAKRQAWRDLLEVRAALG